MIASLSLSTFFFFFFNDTAPTEIYTLSLHDALPIWRKSSAAPPCTRQSPASPTAPRSEEHTSELQSPGDLVCRLLLEKKKKIQRSHVVIRQCLRGAAQTRLCVPR